MYVETFDFHLLSDLTTEVEAQEYLYYQTGLWWSPGKAFCECFGTLARFDTEAEFNHFRTQTYRGEFCIHRDGGLPPESSPPHVNRQTLLKALALPFLAVGNKLYIFEGIDSNPTHVYCLFTQI